MTRKRCFWGFLSTLFLALMISVYHRIDLKTQMIVGVAVDSSSSAMPMTITRELTHRNINIEQNDPSSRRQMDVPEGLKLLSLQDMNFGIMNMDLTIQQAETRFYNYVLRQDAECGHTIRLGKDGDGGWSMCTAGPYRPGPNCTVYSFGIGYDWSFDDDAWDTFGCEVKSYDPTMRSVGDHRHGAGVLFFKTGLSGHNFRTSKNWKMKTLGTILLDNQDDQKVIDYLKFDIEYSEWDAMETMFREGVLSRVKQLGLEIHTVDVNTNRKVGSSTVQDYNRYWRVLSLLEKSGFRKWYLHTNPLGKFESQHTHKWRSCCYELVYINTRYLVESNEENFPPLNVSLGYEPTLPPLLKKVRLHEDTDRVKDTYVRNDIIIHFNVTLPPRFRLLPSAYQPMDVYYDIDAKDAESLYYESVRRRLISCPDHKRIGGLGGWNVCTAGPYALNVPCVAYAFSIGTDWKFEDGIVQEYGCHVHAFDPSLPNGRSQRIAGKLLTYNTGLSGNNKVTNSGWKMETFGKILHQLRSDKVIDVLKVDIEQGEWASLRAMFLEGSLKRVKQLVIETHTKELGKRATTSASDFMEYWQILQNMEERGFMKWYSHETKHGRYTSARTGQLRNCCYRSSYLNVNFMNDNVS